MTVTTATTPLDLGEIRCLVDEVLETFLARQELTFPLTATAEVTRTLREFLFAGGKRLRPVLCVVGWYAAHGGREPPPATVVRTAASLEMFHAFALVHDDVMDDSATRRGRPTVHRALAAHHHHGGRSGHAADQLGAGAAILIGDLALCWSDELLHTAGLSPGHLAALLPLVDVLRRELIYGQYLDLTATGNPSADTGRALEIVRYKTATYTVERPLHIGATLGGADAALRAALSAYAIPLGEAFQLRDDLLGVYGDPAVTGKSCTDDLREGKHTALVALALSHATSAQRHTLRTLLGDPALDEIGAERLRHCLTDTGAQRTVERMIRTRRERAERALDAAELPLAATAALRDIAQAVTARTT